MFNIKLVMGEALHRFKKVKRIYNLEHSSYFPQ